MPTMTKVECDPNHIYRVGGVIKPGFSEMCRAVGFPDNPFWTEAAREEGVALHTWALFMAQGKKPIELPDPRIVRRVNGIRRFLTEHEFILKGGETPIWSPEFGFCCTPDIFGYLDGHAAVVEMKRGAKMKRHRLQTAAQVLALDTNGFAASKRFCLYLKDGGYDLVEHDDDEDFECFKAIVSGYHAREAYK